MNGLTDRNIPKLWAMCAPWRSFSAKEEGFRRPEHSRNVWLTARNDWGHRVARRVHGDPMVGKDQMGLCWDPRHMAFRAGLARDVRLVKLSGMAFPAGDVIGRE